MVPSLEKDALSRLDKTRKWNSSNMGRLRGDERLADGNDPASSIISKPLLIRSSIIIPRTVPQLLFHLLRWPSNPFEVLVLHGTARTAGTRNIPTTFLLRDLSSGRCGTVLNIRTFEPFLGVRIDA
jgi:hypothetical protein